MYQCLKISEIKRAEKPPYYLSSFLDLERAEVFKVYTSNYPIDLSCKAKKCTESSPR